MSNASNTGALGNNTATGATFANSGARIERLNDRVFLGGATIADGNFPPSTNDWLATFYDSVAGGSYTNYVSSAKLFVTSDTNSNDAVGVQTGVQTVHFTASGTAALGFYSTVLNNNTTYSTNAWAYYAEAHRLVTTTNQTFACEFDVRNQIGGNQASNPYQQGLSVCMQLGSGAGTAATHPNDACIQVVSNPDAFNAGIVFGSAAIALTGHGSTTGTAVALAVGHAIEWYYSNGNKGGSIYNTNSTSNVLAGDLQFLYGGIQINEASTNQICCQFQVQGTNNGYLIFQGGLQATFSQIQAFGTNNDLALVGTGTGLVRFGVYTAGVVAQAGYITVKDYGGTSRRLLVG